MAGNYPDYVSGDDSYNDSTSPTGQYGRVAFNDDQFSPSTFSDFQYPQTTAGLHLPNRGFTSLSSAALHQSQHEPNMPYANDPHQLFEYILPRSEDAFFSGLEIQDPDPNTGNVSHSHGFSTQAPQTLFTTNEVPKKRRIESSEIEHGRKRVKRGQENLPQPCLDERAASLCRTWLWNYRKIPDSQDFNDLARITLSPPENVESWFQNALMNGAIASTDSGLGNSLNPSSLSSTNREEISIAPSQRFSLVPRVNRRSELAESTYSSRVRTAHSNFPETDQYASNSFQSSSHSSSHAVHEQGGNEIASLDLDDTRKAALARAASRGCHLKDKSSKCKPTGDAALLLGTSHRRFQCTRKCGQKFQKKDDWRKHEEIVFPQEGWVCLLGTTVTVEGTRQCAYCEEVDPADDHAETQHRKHWVACQGNRYGFCDKSFYRKQHFKQHFKTVHSHLQASSYEESSHFSIKSDFSKYCGFCRKANSLSTWKDRINHIAEHFKVQGKHMRDWHEPSIPDNTDEKAPRHQKESDSDSESDDDEDKDDDPHQSMPQRRSSKFGSRGSNQGGYFFNTTRPEGSNRDASPRRQAYYGSIVDLPCLSPPGLPQQENGRKDTSDTSSCAISALLNPAKSSCLSAHNLPEVASFPSPPTHPYGMFWGIRYLGCGSSGIVDEVLHLPTNRRYARKTLFNPARGFVQELEILSRLHHRHIVQLVGTIVNPLSQSLLFEPVAEMTLEKYLEQPSPNTAKPYLELTQQLGCIASALLCLHSSKNPDCEMIAHNDIKPANILVTQTGRWVLGDFGSARWVKEDSGLHMNRITRTAAYSAPETMVQWAASTKADVFSLGCVFLEVMSWSIVGTQALRTFKSQNFRNEKIYSRNLPQVYEWLAILRINARDNYRLKAQMQMVQLMMDIDPLRRPTASDVCQVFSPAYCCQPEPETWLCHPIDLQQNHIPSISSLGGRGLDAIALRTLDFSFLKTLGEIAPKKASFSCFVIINLCKMDRVKLKALFREHQELNHKPRFAENLKVIQKDYCDSPSEYFGVAIAIQLEATSKLPKSNADRYFAILKYGYASLSRTALDSVGGLTASDSLRKLDWFVTQISLVKTRLIRITA
ncbi:MAG: hypothetical protein MMC33_001224 [Icmadophila ericetorum]|nr:hypothetical protein [Icmadophila ericetorum]